MSRGLCGLTYGYSSNQLNSNNWLGTPNASKVNIDTHTFLAYGLARIYGDLFATGKIGYTWAAYDGFRRPWQNYTVDWTTDSGTFLSQATVGYRLVKGARLSLTPKFKFGYFNGVQASYRENWSDGSLNDIGAFANGYTQYEMLIDMTAAISQSVSLTGSLGWSAIRGAEGSLQSTNLGGVNTLVRGIFPSENNLVLDLGIDAMLTQNLTLIAEYNLRSGEGGFDLHGGRGSLIWRF